MKDEKSFTYIEILLTLAIMAVLFVPMMQLFSYALYSAGYSGEVLTAVNLTQVQMERIKNLTLTKAQLREKGDTWAPALDEPPLELNQTKWRVLSRFKPGTNPLQVNVEAYLAEDLNRPMASLVTLIEDNLWTQDQ